MTLPSPLLMAPIGVMGLCGQDGHGDLATAEAAARTGVPMIASTLSADPMEQVAALFGGTPGFFQLYPPTDRDLAASLVSRAEAAGFRAIVVTLDTWLTGWRPRDLAASNFPQLRGHCLANYFTDPVFLDLLGAHPADDPAAAVGLSARLFGNPITWDDLPWLRSLTTLPLLVKGVCHPDDAPGQRRRGGRDLLLDPRRAPGRRRAARPGLPARRGGRRLRSARALRLRHPVRRRRGQGPGAGCHRGGVGRPCAYGPAIGGADGLVHVLRSILAEADLIMAVDGYPSLADLTPDSLRRTCSHG